MERRRWLDRIYFEVRFRLRSFRSRGFIFIFFFLYGSSLVIVRFEIEVFGV